MLLVLDSFLYTAGEVRRPLPPCPDPFSSAPAFLPSLLSLVTAIATNSTILSC